MTKQSGPAPDATFDELEPVALAALDVVMGAMGFKRIAGGDLNEPGGDHDQTEKD
jgi:hypothetical protein